MGLFGIMITIGFSLGQGISSIIKNNWSMDGLFITAGLLSTVSLFMILTIKEDKRVIEQNCIDKGYTTFWQKVIPKVEN